MPITSVVRAEYTASISMPLFTLFSSDIFFEISSPFDFSGGGLFYVAAVKND